MEEEELEELGEERAVGGAEGGRGRDADDDGLRVVELRDVRSERVECAHARGCACGCACGCARGCVRGRGRTEVEGAAHGGEEALGADARGLGRGARVAGGRGRERDGREGAREARAEVLAQARERAARDERDGHERDAREAPVLRKVAHRRHTLCRARCQQLLAKCHPRLLLILWFF